MKRLLSRELIISLGAIVIFSLMIGCNGNYNFLSEQPTLLKITNPTKPVDDKDDDYYTQDISPDEDSATGLHPIFNGILGIPISNYSIGIVEPDDTGLHVYEDWDGDGIPNDEEIFSNPFVSDYPRIVTRVTTPIIMEIRVLENDITQNHTEIIEEDGVKETLTNSMEDKHYASFNEKTTPYVTKDQYSISQQEADSFGYGDQSTSSIGGSLGISYVNLGANVSDSSVMNFNISHEEAFSKSEMSEKTVFEDVDYIDNLDRNGIEYTNETVENIAKNYRQSEISKTDFSIEPDAGYVRAAFYIKNVTVNMPVRMSNVRCSLTFKTPGGSFLPVIDFDLKNADNSDFEQVIYGGEELGPFVIDIEHLNTFDVKNALKNGYMPQVHIISYDMGKIEESNYQPGVDNLKLVEEVIKARTATIKITAPGMRELFRVPAFELDSYGNISPGISLKKAMFNIFRKRIGDGEEWILDKELEDLTVSDADLRWKPGAINPDEHSFGENTKGNKWDKFSTYVKNYTVIETDDEGNSIKVEKMIETIRKIGDAEIYNPFDKEYNTTYDPSELLSETEIRKMKYWLILHNGEYFEGDINDAIWAGDRYEIILFDCNDFNLHFQNFNYTPLQASTWNTFDTRWNRLSNEGDFARALKIGKVGLGDVIKLEINLDEYRSLFAPELYSKEFSKPIRLTDIPGNIWYKFNYAFDQGDPPVQGIPSDFTFNAFGDYNSIVLNIAESESAHYYTVSFWDYENGDPENPAVVRFEPSDIQENGGYVFINSKSKDISGSEVDTIAGDTIYSIKVRAHGLNYNVPVSTLGTFENVTTKNVTVKAVLDTEPPGAFKFKAIGQLKQIYIDVDPSEDAEFYLIKVFGPYNYGYNNEPPAAPEITKIGHYGRNILSIANISEDTIGQKTSLTSEEESREAPGVYTVEVSAVNINAIYNGIIDESMIKTADGDPQFVNVSYERNLEYRDLSPARQIPAFDPRDVDLEVNFNEGSGWFRLRLSHDDIAEDDRVIDCRYTTSFIQDRQIVNIYVTPPSGSEGVQNTDYNVFRGGVDEVDMYVRTAAKPEYRDTLWLRPNWADINDPDSELSFDPTHENVRYINVNMEINDLPEFDIFKYWVESELTDATMIDEYDILNSTRIFPNYSALVGNVDFGDFGIVSTKGKKDFFFSPVEHARFKMRASYSDADVAAMLDDINHADRPTYRLNAGNRKINLSHLDTQYADKLEIWWRMKNPQFDVDKWNYAEVNLADDIHSFEINTMTVHEKLYDTNGDPYAGNEIDVILYPNTEYVIYVVAKNSISESVKIYGNVITMPEAEETLIADPVELEFGKYAFYGPNSPLTNNFGNILMNGGNDFAYEEPMIPFGTEYHDIFDPGLGTDEFEPGKYIRIVHDGANIIDEYGLGLVPVAKHLNPGQFRSPSSMFCYVDPLRGEFVLPRPSYWTRFEKLSNITNEANISEIQPLSDLNIDPLAGWPSSISHTEEFKSSNPFGLSLHEKWYAFGVWSGGHSRGSRLIYPYGNTTQDIQKGTISFWGSLNTIYSENGELCYGNAYAAWNLISDVLQVRIWSFMNNVETPNNVMQCAIFINDLDNSVASVEFGPSGQVYHFYIVWDRDKSMDGKSVIVYVNNVEILSTTADLPESLSSVDSPYFEVYGDAFGQGVFWNDPMSLLFYGQAIAESYTDNLKWFNHVVSTVSSHVETPAGPDWEYNGGAGNEKGLHIIYGEGLGYSYRPAVKEDVNGGVGYYCIPLW